MNQAVKFFFAAALWGGALAAMAQQTSVNVVQFSASSVLEAAQDELIVTLGTQRDGSDPMAVQAQLKAVLQASLTDARASAQIGAMDVRTGNFSVQPRYGRDGRPSGWQGSAVMVLAGRDFERIGRTAGRIHGMTVSGVVFALSREQRARMESQAQAQAIERFRARAGEITRAFGFASYELREVAISSQELGAPPRPRLMAMEAGSRASDAPLPLEAAKASLQVTVSGAVQLK